MVAPTSAHSTTPLGASTDFRDKSSDIAQRIRGEFREMPGLSLTLAQAARLWNVDQKTCLSVLGTLVDEKFLACRAGRYFMQGRGWDPAPLS